MDRHYQRIDRRWKRLKRRLVPCGCGGKAGLNESWSRRFRRYWIECDDCHWCVAYYPTIRSAIRAWNRDMKHWNKDWEE